MSQLHEPRRGVGTEPIDPRGPRFAAALTSVVLAAVLAHRARPGRHRAARRSRRVAVRRRGVARGHPHAVRLAVPARWSARASARPTHLEDAAPPQFAQAVGFVFAIVGARRLPVRRHRRRPGRHRPRARRRPAQRGLRLLPGLRDLPAGPPGRRPLDRPQPPPAPPPRRTA